MFKLYMRMAAMVRAPLDEVELLVLAIPEVLTESGIVSTYTFMGIRIAMTAFVTITTKSNNIGFL